MSTANNMRKQYNFWPGKDGLKAWDVDRLIELSRNLPVKSINLADLDEVDSDYWFKDRQPPTVRAVVEHARLIEAADLAYPIILASNGRIMDGMHRVAKAVLLGLRTIQAVQFDEQPKPDYVGKQPDALPYER
jgi:hypothetical protein